MPNYNVSVKSSNYQVLSEPQKKYNVGVNYEIPVSIFSMVMRYSIQLVGYLMDLILDFH